MVAVADIADLPDLLSLFRSEGIVPDRLAEALERELDTGGVTLERLAAYHGLDWPAWEPSPETLRRRRYPAKA